MSTPSPNPAQGTTPTDWRTFLLKTGKFSEANDKEVLDKLAKKKTTPGDLVLSSQTEWETWLRDAGVTDSDDRAAIIPYLHQLKDSPLASTRPSSAGSAKMSPIALPDDFFTRDITILDLEGLKATPWRMKRDDLCKALIRIVDDYTLSRNILLVRGPFSSGKTALAQLLHYKIRQQHTAHIVGLSAGHALNWFDFWLAATGVTWDTIMLSTNPVYVVLDEVQIAYPEDSPLYGLWSQVKQCVISKTQQVRFIFFGSYGVPQTGGATTPIEIQPKATISLRAHNGTPGLAYTSVEFDVLCTSFENFARIPIDERSRNFIYHISECHPGIVGITLTCLYENRKRFSLGDAAKDEIYRFLHSAAFHVVMLEGPYRAIPKFADFDKDVRALCKEVVSAESAQVPYDKFNQQLQQCLKVSLLVKEGDFVMFSAPIIKDAALACFFSQGQPKPSSLCNLITAVVQCFSSQQLRNTACRGTNSEILEAQFQHEFFRAAASLLPRDVIISPEYGREKGIKGQVDFYIAQYQWMIEVLRDGMQIAEHERRFLPGGRYHPLLSSVEEWAVIDFRSDKQEVRRHPHPNTYHLSFNDEFTKFTMQDKEFLVMGDSVRATQTDRMPGTTPAKMPRTETNIPK